MRIVVVGLGKVGRALAAQLTAEKHDIVVMDQNPALIDNFVNIYDVRGVPATVPATMCRKKRLKTVPTC